MNDEMWLRIRAGDSDAVAELYADIFPDMVRVARGNGAPGDEGEDAATDAFLGCVATVRSSSHDRSFHRGYFLVAAKHRAIDRARQRSHMAEAYTDEQAEAVARAIEFRLAHEDNREEEDGIKIEGADAIMAMMRCSDRNRMILDMYYCGGMAMQAIADRIGISERGTISAMYRARTELRQRYEEMREPAAVNRVIRHPGGEIERAIRAMTAQQIEALLPVLPDMEAEVLRRTMLEGKSYRQVANELGIGTSTVSNHGYSGRRNLVSLANGGPVLNWSVSRSRTATMRSRRGYAGTPMSAAEYRTLAYLAIGVDYGALAKIVARPYRRRGALQESNGGEYSYGTAARAARALGLKTVGEAVTWMRAFLEKERGIVVDFDRPPIDLAVADRALLRARSSEHNEVLIDQIYMTSLVAEVERLRTAVATLTAISGMSSGARAQLSQRFRRLVPGAALVGRRSAFLKDRQVGEVSDVAD